MEIKKFNEILERFDEVMSLKASKIDISEIKEIGKDI